MSGQLGMRFGTQRKIKRENAICIHEEDFGIQWKHSDMGGGANEVRRSRRLVISSLATIGNYDYGLFWYLYLDGNIECEVKLTLHRLKAWAASACKRLPAVCGALCSVRSQ